MTFHKTLNCAEPKAAAVLIIIPCLNEAAHIEDVVGALAKEAEALNMQIVVADGGSTDGTCDIVQRLAVGNPHITLMHNEKKIQSAGVNKAVAVYGECREFLIRVDAHCSYPANYCSALIQAQKEAGSDCVVVSMTAEGNECFQRAAAAAQNSPLGNGGSVHRMQGGLVQPEASSHPHAARSQANLLRKSCTSITKLLVRLIRRKSHTSVEHGGGDFRRGVLGRYVDHGHHALMRIAAFKAVGGYDESFTHNEDAELDARYRAAGFKIWLSGGEPIGYFPRKTASGLLRQYINYGRGRARTLLKHRMRPKIRQSLPLGVVPAVVVAGIAPLLPKPLSFLAAMPAAVWAAACLSYGAVLGYKHKNKCVAAAGWAAMLMHFGWSLGFCQNVFRALISPRFRAQQAFLAKLDKARAAAQNDQVMP